MEKKKWLEGFFTTEDLEDDVETVEIDNNDVDIPVQTEAAPANANISYRFRLFCPQTYEEASAIADVLKQNCGVIINLQKMTREYSQRMIDFLSGVVYCRNGRIEKIGHRVILCVPHDSDVAGKITL
ncbi:MAG: cell division protein SepF [Solobacterium sp.]|nr:cell division protein SepF [Solobacterium sp.]